jgi:DNA topoisomerase-1
VMSGKYGPYVKWGKVNATIPKDVEPEKVTMDMAVALIVEKVPAKKKSAAKKKPATKKAPAKKAAAKKKDKPKA